MLLPQTFIKLKMYKRHVSRICRIDDQKTKYNTSFSQSIFYNENLINKPPLFQLTNY